MLEMNHQLPKPRAGCLLCTTFFLAVGMAQITITYSVKQ